MMNIIVDNRAVIVNVPRQSLGQMLGDIHQQQQVRNRQLNSNTSTLRKQVRKATMIQEEKQWNG